MKVGIKKTYVWIILVVLVVAGGWYWLSNRGPDTCMTDPIGGMNIGGHQNLALHIHPEVKITINGEDVRIPANEGVGQTFMRPIHTHDETGRLHVEAACPRIFQLGEFFDQIWQVRFTNQCFMDYCTNATHELKFFVNGEPNNQFDLLTLRDRDLIEIVYEARDEA